MLRCLSKLSQRPNNCRELQIEWLITLDSRLLQIQNTDSAVDEATRTWIPNISAVEYTYIEKVRANAPEELNSFESLTKIEGTIASARNGLAFGGMMLGNIGADPISPTWVALTTGALHPNGLVVSAGWPSHRALALPDTLDIGAVDGRNIFQWGVDAPTGQVLPNSKLYVGNAQEQHFEMSRIGGSISSIDLSRDGHSAAIS